MTELPPRTELELSWTGSWKWTEKAEVADGYYGVLISATEAGTEGPVITIYGYIEGNQQQCHLGTKPEQK